MIQEKAARSGEADRQARLAQVLEELTTGRLAGDPIRDEAVIAAHPDLMPELRAELFELGQVEQARRRALSPDSRTGTLAASATADPSAVSSDSFYGYEILGEIHRGGQGVVYQALQKATKRKVALKVMRESPSTTVRDKARFEQEVHILGQLKHPNIVAIHDSGSAADQFYYVMDYIPGRPLDQFVAAKDRPVDEILRLFAQVCEAVNAAHLRGIIHRDLKPGNILIDENGAPHILDFGLAKVTGSEVTNDSGPRAMTVTGQFVGSLPWASPEQVEGQPAKIDLRTDVYSLGVTLYQALTGRFPYDVSGNVRDVLDNILKVEPARPSTIRRHINDEVETMVLKCLAKTPERRYQSAGELARDIRHYLSGEPIEAKRDSAWYVFRKTLRRYKVAAAVAASFVILVTASTVALSVMYGIQKRERERSDEARFTAQSQATKSELIQVFLQDILGSVDPDIAQGSDISLLRKILGDAARRVESELRGQAEAEASIRATIGSAYMNIGLYDEAEPHLRRALALREQLFAETGPEVAQSLNSLGSLLSLKGDWAGAGPLHARALDIRRRLWGDTRPEIAESLNNLAELSREQGDYAAAEPLYREALAIFRRTRGDDHEDVAAVLVNLGIAARSRTDLSQAEELFRESLAIRRKVFGDRHHSVADSLNALASLCGDRGDPTAGEPLAREAVEILRRNLGNEHPNLAPALMNLANLLHRKGDYVEAEELHREALAILRRSAGAEHIGVAVGLEQLAAVLRDKGDLAGAKPLVREAVALYRKRLGEEAPQLAHPLVTLGMALQQEGDLAGGESAFREALNVRLKVLPEDHPDISLSQIMLAMLLLQRGNPVDAEPLMRECLRIRRGALQPGDWRIAQTESVLGECLADLGQHDEAEPLLVKSYPVVKAQWGEGDKRTREARQRLVKLYEAWGKPDRAAEYQASDAQPDLRSFRDRD